MLKKRLFAAVSLMLMLTTLLCGSAYAQMMQNRITISPADTGSVALNPGNIETARMVFTIRNTNETPTAVAVARDGLPLQTLTPTADYTFDRRALTLLFSRGTGTTLQPNDLGEYILANGYGMYNIRIDFPSNVLSTTFYVFNEQTIVFITQPATVVVDKDDDATFSVAVTGTNNNSYAYQWQRRGRTGWKDVQGATTATMMITTVESYLTGYQYRCKVSSSAGEAYSDTAYLTVRNVPGTGDGAHPWLYAILALLSLCLLVACVLRSSTHDKTRYASRAE